MTTPSTRSFSAKSCNRPAAQDKHVPSRCFCRWPRMLRCRRRPLHRSESAQLFTKTFSFFKRVAFFLAKRQHTELFIFIPRFFGGFSFDGVRRTFDSFFLSYNKLALPVSSLLSFCFFVFSSLFSESLNTPRHISFSTLPRCQRSRRQFCLFFSIF